MDDRKLKLRKIADTLKISEGSVFIILHESLVMRKLFSKWVPRLLTPDQKQQRVEDSERCLELLKRDKKDFLRWYVSMWNGFTTTHLKQKDHHQKIKPPDCRRKGDVRLKTDTLIHEVTQEIVDS